MAASGTLLLTVDVLLNGRGPFRFVVDTGADRSVIADTVAHDLGLLIGRVVRVQGIIRAMETSSVTVTNLVAGPVHRENLELPVLPRELLQADGYLGLDVLDGYRVSLDFRAGELRLLEPRPVQAIGPGAPHEVPIKVSGQGGHLRTTACLVDGVRCTAFIDTGAEISVGNTSLFEKLSPEHGHNFLSTVPLTGVTGGVISGGIVEIDTVLFGGLTFGQSRIAIADLEVFQKWNIADRPSLLIGMNWLRRFNRVAIDYRHKELRFDLAIASSEAPMRCKPGEPGCHYLLGSPNTIPRPSVAT